MPSYVRFPPIGNTISISEIIYMKRDSNDDVVNDMSSSSSTLLGLILSMALIIILAISPISPNSVVPTHERSTENVVKVMNEENRPINSQIQQFSDQILLIGGNVLNAAIPTNVPDAAAVAVAEGLAGILSSSTVYTVTVLPALVRRYYRKRKQMSLPSPVEKKDEVVGESSDFTEAVARVDFVYARSAASAFLQSTSMTAQGSSAVAILLAQLPYQFIKQRAKLAEKALEDSKLRPKATKSLVNKTKSAGFMGTLPDVLVDENDAGKNKKIRPPIWSLIGSIEWVDVMTDLIIWLEFDILTTDLAPSQGIPLNGLTAAMFGFVAALSSQLYRDFAESVGKGLRLSAASFSNIDTQEDLLLKIGQRYWGSCASSASFFGLFEAVQQPLSDIVTQVIHSTD